MQTVEVIENHGNIIAAGVRVAGEMSLRVSRRGHGLEVTGTPDQLKLWARGTMRVASNSLPSATFSETLLTLAHRR